MNPAARPDDVVVQICTPASKSDGTLLHANLGHLVKGDPTASTRATYWPGRSSAVGSCGGVNLASLNHAISVIGGGPHPADATTRSETVLSFDQNGYEDGFALIVSAPGTPLTLRAEPRPTRGQLRARRFDVSMPLRYRFADDHDWRGGVTRNISHSGLLFDADQTDSAQRSLVAVTSGTPVDLVINVLTGTGDATTRVRSEGRLIRITGSAPKSIAVAVRGYWVQ